MPLSPSASAPSPAPRATEPDIHALYTAQKSLVRAVQELSLARTLPAIQAVVRHAARQISGADGATFVLRDHDQCFYADEDAIAPLWKGQRFPLSSCISGWAMLNGVPAIIPDIYADARIPQDAYQPTFVKSLVMVPIRPKAPIGAIGVYWAQHHHASAEQVELLQALANTTSVAMENVEVYRGLEQRVAERTRQLETLNDELEAFSYSVSHDLRAPLRAIIGFSDLLSSHVSDHPQADAQRCLQRIKDGAARMGRLIDDLLELSRVSRHEMHYAATDVAVTCRAILERLRTAEPHRQVSVTCPDRLVVRCDPRLMEIVLENLLSNAWKYTGKTERATIEIGSQRAPSGEIAVYVRDNGAGFNPDYADGLFKPFCRLHSADQFSGTGIGLAIVHRIIRRHGGQISATAAVDQGATFTFSSPEFAEASG